MRNRAKCKLCLSIIESIKENDYAVCKCGEIAVSGGTIHYNCGAIDWANFIRIDDNDVEVPIKVKEKELIISEVNEKRPTKEELITMLEEMIKNIESLPSHAMTAPITHYDLCSSLLLIASIFRAKESD